MEALRLIRGWWNDLLSVIFPRVCEVCGRQLVDGEELICTYCNASMPRTNYHVSDFNPVHHRLAASACVDKASSWFEYRRTSPYVELILKAKYYDRPDIARDMGRIYSREIFRSGFFDGIDIILPVPMHHIKQLKRGYNQAEEIAVGISRTTRIPIGDNLRALHGHSSQTRRGAFERYLNVAGLFGVANPAELAGHHVLLVDDVLTTGSTLSSCCDALRKAVPDIRVSVLTLAATTR